MKEAFTSGVYRPKQNQMFKMGKSDGLFDRTPRYAANPDYMDGFEDGKRFRAELVAAGARVMQPPLFQDQFNKGKE